MSTKQQVSQILNIENTEDWNIVDSDGDLHLVHYSNKADLAKYGYLRGIVVDVAEGKVVCSSFGYAPSFTVHSLENTQYSLPDEYGKMHDIDLSQARFRIGYEGTILRVFKHKGKVYFSTHRRLDASNSRWGNSKTFTEMYFELGGPTGEQLFKTDSSDSVYVFLVSHPDVLICSKVPTTSGFLVLLDKLGSEETDLPLVHDKDYLDGAGILSSRYLDLEEANRFLRTGFHGCEDAKDERLSSGEFVIAEVPNGQYGNYPGQEISLYKFSSPAYEWRSAMRGKDSNLYHRFFLLATDSYGKKSLDQYYQEYPIVATYMPETEVQDKLEQGFLLSWPEDGKRNALLHSRRPTNICLLYNIWACFLLSVPLPFQKDVAHFLSSYRQDKKMLIEWVFDKWDNEEDLPDIPRLGSLLNQAENNAHKETHGMIDKQQHFADSVHRNISRLVHREYGKSLYKMVRGAKKDRE